MTNKKSTKRALLTSILSLLLCCSMLIGTTFAWFTDEVKSANNIITAGNLDVELYHKDKAVTGDPEKVTGSTVLFDDVTLWEPGAVAYETLTVKNEGTLALKYSLGINISDANFVKDSEGKLHSLAEVLKIAVVDATKLSSRDAAIAAGAEKGWMNLQSIIESGELYAEQGKDVATYGIVIYWEPNANDNIWNLNNGKKAEDGSEKLTITLGVSLFATQVESEYDSFDNKYDEDAYVENAANLAEILTSNDESILVVLNENVDLPITSLGTITPGSGEYKLGGQDTESITIDLNGKTLNITTGYWSALGAVNPNATITIKNGTMVSTGNSASTWNANDLRFSNCNWVFENVTFNKEVALDNVGKTTTMKNVTINGTGDYYALWITTEGQNVTIDGLTVNTPGRGIKIDNQYVDNSSKVTLSVSNAKFTTAKKAAILVKSPAGADITLSDLNIVGVAADPFNEVWVDEDGASYADLVTVTGGDKVVEGKSNVTSNSVPADTTVAMGNVINAGGETVIDNKGTIDLSGTPNLNGGNVVINGGTVVTTSTNYTGLQHAGTVVYNNVTFEGSTFLYGDKVVFNNCTFNLSTNYVWTYGAKEVEFNNCTFNTEGKAILIYNEGAGASKVTVKGCTFNATTGAKAGAITNQNCAAIEIDNHQNSGTGAAHILITEGNTYSSNFSGEWRIKNFVSGNAVTVNGVEYTKTALDGNLMTVTNKVAAFD